MVRSKRSSGQYFRPFITSHTGQFSVIRQPGKRRAPARSRSSRCATPPWPCAKSRNPESRENAAARPRPEISLASAHPFRMERHAGMSLRSGNQQAVVLHENHHGHLAMGSLVGLSRRLHRFRQSPAGIGVGHPERREFARGCNFRQSLQSGPAIQGVGGDGMSMNNDSAQHRVKRGFNRRPPVAADDGGSEMLQHAGFTRVGFQRGQVLPIKNAAGPPPRLLPPNPRFAHGRQGGTTRLDAIVCPSGDFTDVFPPPACT